MTRDEFDQYNYLDEKLDKEAMKLLKKERPDLVVEGWFFGYSYGDKLLYLPPVGQLVDREYDEFILQVDKILEV